MCFDISVDKQVCRFNISVPDPCSRCRFSEARFDFSVDESAAVADSA
jgi:hypothetical protein